MSQNERKIELDSKFLEEYSELLLKSAVRRYSREQEKEFDALYEEAGKDPECQPSPEAKKRYRRSVKQYQRRRFAKSLPGKIKRVSKYAACFLLIAVGIFTLRFVTVDAFREEVVNYLVKMTERYTQYTIVVESKNNAKKPEGWDFEYYPHYVPEGYFIDRVSQLKYQANISYRNKEGSTYKVQIYDAVHGGFQRSDSENAEYKFVEINGMEGEMYIKDSHTILVFTNSQYLFAITGDLSEDEIILVARSIKDEE